MNSSRRWRHLLRSIGVLCLAAACAEGEISPLDCLPVPEDKPPGRPMHDLWIEGEDAACPAGWTVVDQADCYGGRQIVLLSLSAGEPVLSFPFRVKEKGSYLIRIAGQTIGQPWTSSLSLSLDDGAWQHVTPRDASKVCWGVSSAVTWMNLTLADLDDGLHTLRLRVDGPRADGYFAYAVDAICLLKNPAERLKVPAVLTSHRTGHVFTTAEPVAFQFVIWPGAKSWEWVVANWQQKTLRTGQWRSDTNCLQLPDLPLGYFTLKIRPQGQSHWSKPIPFARVVDPATRQTRADCPYALDSVLSWLPEPNKYMPADPRGALADLVKLLGVPMVRDRVSWVGTSPKPGEYAFGWYLESAEMLAKNGTGVCQMFHDSPAWAANGSEGIPQDLLEVYRYAQAAGKAFAGKAQAWEFWNEQDAGATWPWNFAAAQKAAYLGFKSASPDIQVLIGSNCVHPTPRYMELLMENGVADYFDIFNFHLYKELGEYETIVRDKKHFLQRYGAACKPIWCTENGFASEGPGLSEPLIAGSTKREHNEHQEREQAKFLVKAQIMLQAFGVARDFSFALKPYNEYLDGKVWGLLRWDWTVKPAFVALANLTAQLGDCRYAGRMDLAPDVAGYLFTDADGGQVLVYWSESASARSFTLSDQRAELVRSDLMGQQTTLRAGDGRHRLTATADPAYLRGVKGCVAKTPTSVPCPVPATMPKNESAIVLRLLPDSAVQMKKNYICLSPSERSRFVLDVYNFSSTLKHVQLRDRSVGCVLAEPLPKELAVPPLASVRVPIAVSLASAPIQGLAHLRFDGVCQDRSISPVSIPVMPDSAEMIRSLRAAPIDLVRADRWTPASSGRMWIEDDPAEKAVRFKVVFPDTGDRWVYPGAALHANDATLAGAVGIGFEIKCQGDIVGSALVMAGTEDKLENGRSYYFNYDRSHEWRHVVILFQSDAPASFDPASVRTLQIGANPGIQEYTYWVRNIRAYYRP